MAKTVREWVGGRFPMPGYVMEGGPFRPDMDLWVELPEGYVIGIEVIDRREPNPFASSLTKTIQAPKQGDPRDPDRVRVADEALAGELRQAFPGLEITVAPVPELQQLVDEMMRSMPGEEATSYLEDGRIPEDVMSELFRAAKTLWEIAPWKFAGDDQLIRVDVPAFGIEGVVLSIIGALGESFGFLIFPSLEGYEAFADLAEREERDPEAPLDLGTTYVALEFERGADLPAALRREVAEHGWPVAGPEAYPRVHARDRDGMLRPPEVRDVRALEAIAAALPVFVLQHRELFAAEEVEPVSVSYHGRDDVEVRFTLPFGAFDLFEPVERASSPAAPRSRVGRNDPCPCGSGRKYKKCCLRKESEELARGGSESLHELDLRMAKVLAGFAQERFGDVLLDATDDFADWRNVMQLAVPWSVYGFPVEGRPVVDWYLEKRRGKLGPTELGWLERQRRAWLGVWEVAAVEPGRGVTVRELLSGEERFVEERLGSKMVVARDTILARVVDAAEASLFCGLHPRTLPPRAAAEVVRRARGRLRRKGAAPPERLRDGDFGRYLIRRWEEAVARLDKQRSLPPELRNTGGDPILLTTDHYAFDPARRDEVLERVAGLGGAEESGNRAGETCFDFLRENARRPGDTVLFGRIRVGREALRLEANSVARAGELRSALEHACGDLVRHRAREHTDPRGAMKRGAARSGDRERIPGAEQIALQFKEQHYAGWVDESLPALGGQTPREASRTRSGREQLDLLLRDMENTEARAAEGERYDFSRLRSELGL